MAQDFTVKVGFDDSSMKKMGREFATIFEGLSNRAASGRRPGMAGGAAESLVKMIPGGAFFTNIGKAFAQGGLFVGMAAGITSFVAIGKSLLSSSKVFQTMTGTFFKTVGAMIDMMLAPLIPIFMKFLSWWIREGFKWAQKAGQFLAEWLPRIGEFLGTVIDAIGGMRTVMYSILALLSAWFLRWTISKAMGGIRGIRSLLRGGRGLLSRGGGGATARSTASIYGVKPAASRGLLGRLGSGLMTRTGARAGLRMGAGFLARRGAAMGAGAAVGGTIGLAGAGVGAVPCAVIGAIAGLVIGQAAGVAIDAATGQDVTVASAVIPGYSEFRDAKEILAAGDEGEWKEKAAQVKAMADAQQADSARALDQNYAALIGRPDSIIPTTMGTLIGVYDTMEGRASEIEGNLQQHDTDDGGFWSTWSGKIKGYWNSAWGTIKGWWNKFFGDSPGAGTADGGNPDENAVEYDGGTWWGGWLSSIGGFFKSAWGTVKGWWNKITGGAEDNEPEENPPDSGDEGGGISGFFSGVYGSIKTKFSDGWNKVKGWWNNIKNAVTNNEPDKDSDPKESLLGSALNNIMGAASAVAGSIKDKFSKGWNKVKGWWQGLKDKVTENEPSEDSDPKDTLMGTALGNIIGGAKAIAGSIKDKFTAGWGKVKGWWQGLKDKVTDNEPKGYSDPNSAQINTSLKDIIGGAGAIAGQIGGTIKSLFSSGVDKVTGWWSGLKDKVNDNVPKESDGNSILTTLGTTLSNIAGNIKGGLSNLAGWASRKAQAALDKLKNLPGVGTVTNWVSGGNNANLDPSYETQAANRGGRVSLQTGGVIPGPAGMLGLAAVHSGETILPTHLGPDWLNSTKGGSAFKRMMGGGMSGGWGSSSGGVNTTHMTMNRPTIINISTTESTSEVLTSLSQLEMLEDAAFFSSLA